MKRVLVTGLGGFIGKHVRAPLERRGFEVQGNEIDLLGEGAAARTVAAARPTHLLHLAWTSSAARMRDPAENAAWAKASVALFEAFTRAGGERAAFAGSCAEYDWSRGTLSESSTPSRPVTPYGESKNDVRRSVEGGNTAWARLFFLYGPHEPRGRLVSDICAGLLEGREIELTEGRQQRDYLHAEDAAEALVALLDSDVRGTINVASGSAVAVRDIARTLGELAGQPELLAFGRRPMAAQDPPLLVADTTRLRGELGFVPRYRLEAGLQQTLEWWRSHG